MPRRHELRWTASIFVVVTCFLTWLVGARLVLVNDEGIYLDGAINLLHGSLPYRDFFALTGPGTFWNLAVVFQLFGPSLAAARMLLILDLAVICACMYWLVGRFHSRALGLWTTGLYLAVLTADKGSLVVNHRWDSTACCILATTWFTYAITSGKSWPLIAAGAASAYAAWITPPMGLIAVVMLSWTLLRMHKGSALAFVIGAASTSIGAMAALAWTGSLMPLVKALFWTASQYSTANRFAYGAIIGGYSQLFDGVTGIDLVFRAFLVILVALPAILPLVGVALHVSRPSLLKGPHLLAALCGIAAIAGCYPRMDNGHLVYAAPFWYVCGFPALASALPSRARVPLALVASLGAAIFGFSAIATRAALAGTTARAGRLVGEPTELTLVSDLERSIASNDAFFAFPYLPIAYFLTRGTNPTRYSFLQPGMMSDTDEQIALDALTRAPPRRMLYMRVPASAYLRLFPSSDPSRLEMHKIEEWLGRCYQPSAWFSKAHPGYELLSWRGTGQEYCLAGRGYN